MSSFELAGAASQQSQIRSIGIFSIYFILNYTIKDNNDTVDFSNRNFYC